MRKTQSEKSENQDSKLKMKSIIRKIKRTAKAYFKDTNGSHGFDHTERVVSLTLHIGKKEGADLTVLELAALLHDIGRKREDESLGKICHAEEGARLAQKILRRHRISDEIIKNVVHCIRHHRYRKNSKPDTLEAKIIFDADKLDAIGAVGIGRAFLFAGEHGAKLHNSAHIDMAKTAAYSSEDTAYREFLYKLRHVHEKMLTREGGRLAKKRHEFMLAFFDRLHEECEGEL
jgi:uncharacterized protein